MIYADIGSISHKTERVEDLIPVFCDELRNLHEINAMSLPEDLLEIAQSMAVDGYFDSEEAAYDLNEYLSNALDEFAPPYCYFGAHEGDGSDYGFWPSWCSIEMDLHDGELIKVEDSSEIPEDWTKPVLVVNDHGNTTLLGARDTDGNREVIWAIV